MVIYYINFNQNILIFICKCFQIKIGQSMLFLTFSMRIYHLYQKEVYQVKKFFNFHYCQSLSLFSKLDRIYKVKKYFMQIEQPDNKLNSKIVQKQAKMYQFYKDVKLKNTKNLDKILKILEKEEWTLDLGVYSNLKCKQVMEKIQVCNAEKVWLGYNTKPNILKDIINIKFNFLKQIWITHNHITSIQMLDWIHFPMLTQIWLRDNFIVKIKSLKKFKLPRLATISLYGNRITDIYCLTKALTANMTCIWVEYEDEQPVQGESLSWIAKTQTKILKSLCIGSQRRMKENKVQKIIKEKFPSLKVYKSQKNN